MPIPEPGYWLIVEDDEDDYWLFSRSCSRAFDRPPVCLRVKDAAAAKSFLLEAAHLPNLIISDVKMPGETGFDLLAWIRAQPRFESVPFVILTNSLEQVDVTRARELLADDYLVKPPEIQAFGDLLKSIGKHL